MTDWQSYDFAQGVRAACELFLPALYYFLQRIAGGLGYPGHPPPGYAAGAPDEESRRFYLASPLHGLDLHSSDVNKTETTGSKQRHLADLTFE